MVLLAEGDGCEKLGEELIGMHRKRGFADGLRFVTYQLRYGLALTDTSWGSEL